MKKEFTYKDVERILYSYNEIKAKAKDIEFEIEELKDTYGGIGTSTNDIKPTTPTFKITSSVEGEVEDRNLKLRYLELQKKNKQREIDRIDNMLTTLREDEKEFVDLKYFKKMKNKEIIYKLYSSEETVRRNRNLIVSSLVDFLNKK